jgi:transcriptional regulator with XRE-family HTH domain
MMDEKTFAMVLGRMIVLHRQNLGWSQATLAEVLGTTQSMVSRMERGESSPDPLLLKALAEWFEVNVDELFERVELSTGKAQELARQVSRSGAGKGSKDTDWLKVAAGIIGAAGAVSLVAVAVAAILDEKKK